MLPNKLLWRSYENWNIVIIENAMNILLVSEIVTILLSNKLVKHNYDNATQPPSVRIFLTLW